VKALEKKIAAILLSIKALTEEQLQAAIHRYDGSIPLPDLLLQMGAVTSRDLCRARTEAEGLTFVSLEDHVPTREALETLASGEAWKLQVVPVELDEKGILLVATAEPNNVLLLDELKHKAGRAVKLLVCEGEELEASLKRYYGADPRQRSGSSGENQKPAPEVENTHHAHQKMVRALRESNEEDYLSQMETQAFEKASPEKLESLEKERMEHGTYNEPTQSSVLVKVSALDPDSPRSQLASSIMAFLETGSEEMALEPDGLHCRVRVRQQEGWHDIASHPIGIHDALVGALREVAGVTDHPGATAIEHQFFLPTEKGRHLATIHLERTSCGAERALLRVAENRPLLEEPLAMVGLPGEITKALTIQLTGNKGGLLLVSAPRGRDVAYILSCLLAWINRRGDLSVLSLERPNNRRIPGVSAINCPTEAILLASLANASFMKPDVLAVGDVENGTVLNRLFDVAKRGTLVLGGMVLPSQDLLAPVLKSAQVDTMNFLRVLLGCLHLEALPSVCTRCATTPKEGEALPPWAEEADRSALRTAPGCSACDSTGRSGSVWAAGLVAPDHEAADGRWMKVASMGASARTMARAGWIDFHEETCTIP
jgi:type II secretory ATPase GspE/PulE/Tfp pilus assembly ATPase PilB-like protein